MFAHVTLRGATVTLPLLGSLLCCSKSLLDFLKAQCRILKYGAVKLRRFKFQSGRQRLCGGLLVVRVRHAKTQSGAVRLLKFVTEASR